MKKLIIFILLCLLFFAGCDLTDDQASGLMASKGEYATEIHLSWYAYAPTSDSADAKELKEYELRSDAGLSTTTTTTSYVDTVSPGIKITYDFRIAFTDGSFSDWSSEDWGYAITYTNIQITANPFEYPLTGNTGGLLDDETKADWYLFLAQKNWTYHIQTYSAGPTLNTNIELYDKDNFEAVSGTYKNSANFELLDWNCPASGFYYVCVTADDVSDYNICIDHD